MWILPFVFVVTVCALFALLGRHFLRWHGSRNPGAFASIRGYGLGTLFLLLVGGLADLVICETLLHGESGAMVLVSSILILVGAFVVANLVFVVCVAAGSHARSVPSTPGEACDAGQACDGE